MANTVEIVIKGTDNATGAIKGVKGALNGLSGGLKSAGAAMMSTGAKMSVGITAPLLLIGKQALSTAGDFEAGMNVLAIAARSSGTAMEDLSKAAIVVGKDTDLVGIDARQAADAMTNFYKAGLTTSDVFADLQGYLAGTSELTGALRSAIDLAAASDLDLAQASDLVAVAMATFGISAEEASDIADSFVGAADASVAEVGDLAQALINVGPTMAQFGYSLEDTNIALALLSTRGIKGAEAGTALKSMMTNLMRPTDAVKAALSELNVSLYNTDGTMRSMPEIIGDLSSAMAGMTDEQKNQYIQTLAGTYGMKAMATLLEEGVVGWNEMEAAIGSAASAQEVGTARTQGFNASMEQLQGAIETFMIKAIGPLLPMLAGLVDKIGAFVGMLIEADPQLVQMGIVIAAVAAAAGPLLMALGAISTVLGALLSPIGLVVAAIAALGLAWSTNFLGIRDTLTELWENTIQPIFKKIQWVVEGFINFLSGTPEGMKQFMTAIQFAFGLTRGQAFAWVEMIKGIVEKVKTFFTETIPAAMVAFGEILAPIWANIQNIIAAVWRNIESIIAVVIERVVPLIMNWIGTVKAIVEEAWPVIQNVIMTVWNAIYNIIMMVITQIVPKIIEGFGIVVTWFNENWPAIQALVMEVWGAILSVIQTVINTVVPFIVAQFGVIVAWVNENWPLIKDTITAVLDGVLNVVQSVIGFIRNFWETNHDAIMTVARSVWNIIKSAIETTINAILGIIKAVMLAITGDWEEAWEVIKGVAEEIWEHLQTVFDETMNAIQAVLDLILPVIQELWDTVWTSIKDKAVEIWDVIKNFISDTMRTINQTITRVLNNTFTWITSKVSDWIQAGKDLVGGLAQGITSTIQTVVNAGKNLMNSLKDALLSIPLPVPSFSVGWSSGPLGVQIPHINIGVNWIPLGNMIGGGNANNAATRAAGAAVANAMNAAIRTGAEQIGVGRGWGDALPVGRVGIEQIMPLRGMLEDFGIGRIGGKKGDPSDPIGIGEIWEGGGHAEGTGKDIFPIGLPNVLNPPTRGGAVGGGGGGGGGGGMGGSRIEEILIQIRDMVAAIAGKDPNSEFAGSDLQYKIAGLTA